MRSATQALLTHRHFAIANGWTISAIFLGIGRRMTRQNTTASEFLASAGWLSQTSSDFSAAVLRRCRHTQFEAGEVVYAPGEAATGLYGLASGGAAIAVVAAELGPTVAHFMQPGAWFGENAYSGALRVLGIKTTRRSELFFLSVADINEIVEADWRQWSSFARLSVINSSLAMGAAYDLMIRDPRKRCMATLLRLAGWRHSDLRPSRPEIDISQSDLAHMANLSRNMVGTILQPLRKMNLIDWDYRKVVILQPESLLQLATRD